VFPTVGSVNPSLTIQAIACRTVDRIVELAACGELQDIAVRVCRPLTQECPLLNR
jgi:choline dehydrogenase-like flavoprotein